MPSSVISVMNFVGYQYQGERERQAGGGGAWGLEAVSEVGEDEEDVRGG